MSAIEYILELFKNYFKIELTPEAQQEALLERTTEKVKKIIQQIEDLDNVCIVNPDVFSGDSQNSIHHCQYEFGRIFSELEKKLAAIAERRENKK